MILPASGPVAGVGSRKGRASPSPVPLPLRSRRSDYGFAQLEREGWIREVSDQLEIGEVVK